MERTALILVVLCTACVSLGSCSNVTSQIDENEMGMEVYFDIVKSFLGDVVQRKNISSSFLNLSTVFVDGKFDEDALTDWKQWAEYLIGYAVCAGLGLLFIVVMPLTGLIFCCCRLCGKCGAKHKDYESHRAACKRGSYCTVLLILNTVMLGGAICGLVCVSLFQEHMQSDDGTVPKIQSGLQEVDRFLQTSVVDIDKFVKDEFATISGSILKQVNEAIEIKKDLDSASETLTELQNDTEHLSSDLQEIQTDVERVCNESNPCEGYNAKDYSIQSNFTNLKVLKDEADKVAQSLNMSEYVKQAEKSIEDAKAEATEEIKKETDGAKEAIDDVDKEIKKGLKDLNTQKDDLSKDLHDLQEDLGDRNGDVKKYSDYVYYAGLGIFCVMLLVILLYYVGVLYGLCGERPGQGAPCCNTGTGANFLIAGVAFTFLFTWLLMIVCVLLFLLGGPAYTEVCRYFDGHDPKNFQVFDDALTDGLDISSFYKNPPSDLSLVKTLQDCQKNDPIFSALNLDDIVNLDEILDLQELNKKIAELKKATFNIPNIDILNGDLKRNLQELADSGLESIPFQDYFDQ
ncbi:prominin-1, partial [Elysia marginata]